MIRLAYGPGGGGATIVDPGFLCGGTAPTVSATQIPGSGARQATGLAASLAATSCVSNSPVSGEMTVTAHVAVAHGVSPGQTFALQGFTGTGFTGYNVASYTALAGTTGTTLVGETTTGGGTCPTSPLDTSAHEGTALSGTLGSVTSVALPATNPWARGMSGITASPGKHFCGIVGEYGPDSSFPGAQFVSLVDDKGVALSGSPALVPWLNQGTANFTGYTLANTQSPSSPALIVTAMNSYAVSAATFDPSTGFVTFTTTVSPGFIPGSEFTVTGISPSGYNHTYVAAAGTTAAGTTIVGNPLTGPVGVPAAISNPGSYSSGGGARLRHPSWDAGVGGLLERAQWQRAYLAIWNLRLDRGRRDRHLWPEYQSSPDDDIHRGWNQRRDGDHRKRNEAVSAARCWHGF